MSEFVLSCCSTADKSKEHFEKRNIIYACFHYRIEQEEFEDDLGQSVTFSEFYQKMRNGAMPITSQVNAEEFIQLWEPYLKEGKDLLHVSLSSGISGEINSANIAKEELSDKYPDRKIYVVDSLLASSGYGMFMDYLDDLRQEGKTIDEIYAWAEEHKYNVQSWFYVSDLTWLKKGGRVSASAAMLGTILNICPLMNVDYQGHLIPRKKVRTKNKVMEELVNKMEEHAENGRNYDGKCYICNSDCIEDARKVASMVEERFPALKGKVEIDSIGTVIGAHTGPGTVGLFFVGDRRGETE